MTVAERIIHTMKKAIALFLIPGLLLLGAGCDGAPRRELSDGLPYRAEWMPDDLAQVGLGGLTVDKAEEGRFTPESPTTPRLAYLLGDRDPAENSDCHTVYLAVETAQTVWFADLGDSYAAQIWPCDVDGDGTDEVVVQQTVGMTDGTGQFRSRVFKATEEDMHALFDSGPPDADDGFFDIFTATPKDGFLLEMRSSVTEYAVTLDLSAGEEYVGVYFDEAGKVIGNAALRCDSYWEFLPRDVDGDGVFELVCRQHVFLLDHADCLGDVTSVLKFDTRTRSFRILRTQFTEAP